jgi:hypothetical protein
MEKILSWPLTLNIIALGSLIHMDPFTNDSYKEEYTKYEDFKEVFPYLHG